jgi:hypothetical protein
VFSGFGYESHRRQHQKERHADIPGKGSMSGFCGFDSDGAGDRLAQRMIALYPTIRRLRPPNHDWNDVLQSHPPAPLPLL